MFLPCESGRAAGPGCGSGFGDFGTLDAWPGGVVGFGFAVATTGLAAPCFFALTGRDGDGADDFVCPCAVAELPRMGEPYARVPCDEPRLARSLELEAARPCAVDLAAPCFAFVWDAFRELPAAGCAFAWTARFAAAGSDR